MCYDPLRFSLSFSDLFTHQHTNKHTKPNFPNKKHRRASFDCLRVCIHPFIHSRSLGGSIGPCLASSHSFFQTFLIKNTGGWVSMVCVSASIQYQVSSIKYQVSSIKYQVSSIKYQVSSVKYQVSSVKYQVSSIKCQVSSVKCQVSSIKCLTW